MCRPGRTQQKCHAGAAATQGRIHFKYLCWSKIFSKLDANSGFRQIPLDKTSSYLTAFITPFGRFRFQRLPFGISFAPEHFQRRMSQMLEGISRTVCHMDDI
ncbi:hypothetical protein AVEN_237573-1 [Araneus ventricosus]|uniref:Reverse transcriptase domain-containing protein n=1 Tax=Araneus ventricosus TaxID=182803 RepID=A0A4Y2VSP7_ARAVE|nr:hypothetical protein AVEN_237573-1 [Araneus ventricosus]